MINNFGLDLKFIFENPSKFLNFVDINIRVVENNLVFDIHYKQTSSFNYLTYTSCHTPHTRNNISLSLAKCIATFIRTYNANHNINFKTFHICLDNIKNKQLKTCFQKKKVLLSTRQPPHLCKLLNTAKLGRLLIPKQIKQVRFFLARTASIMKMFFFKIIFIFFVQIQKQTADLAL